MSESVKQIITMIPEREQFYALLRRNPGLVVIKFGAEWCGPCHRIRPEVEEFFASSPDNVICADLDVDVCFNMYSLLKSARMVNGVPALVAYKKGNVSYIPDASITGADPNALKQFFSKCGQLLNSVKD